MKRIYIKDLKGYVGKEVTISGWVDIRRDQGKMVFFDMRDMTGKVQCVVLPTRTEAIEKAKEMRPEWVLKIVGQVNNRPEKNINKGVLNGDIELEVTEIEILNKAETPAFDVTSDGKLVEGTQGVELDAYPALRSFVIGANLKF